jgi:SRSO17 transposase
MENLHVFRPDGKKRIRAHALAVSALIIDRIAIPVGCKPFVSEAYARKKGLTFKTQMDLAIELVREYTPPPGMRVVVLADSGFDCDAFYAQCQRRGFGFVVCLKRNRKLLDPPEAFRQAHPELGRSGVSLSQYCEWLVKTKIFKKIELSDKESEGRKKAFYTYREVSDIENVSDQIGEPVNLLFSGRKINNGKQIRVFVSNLQSLSAAEFSRLYSLRWPIECLFKFLKQELGLGHCQAQSWRAHKQHFALVFIAYLFLVQQRLEQHGQLRLSSSEQAERRGLYGQLRDFRTATDRQQLQPLLRAAESTRPRPRLVERLRRALERADAA